MDTNTQAAEATTEQVTFTSRASNLCVVRSPARRRPIAETGEFEVTKGVRYQFFDGVLGPGELTDDDIAWLRSSDAYGKLFFEPETAPAPENSAGLQTVIMEKALSGDFSGIADILVAERTALSRPEVIAACEAAINAGGAQLPAKPDTPLHEVARVRVGPAAGETPGVSSAPVDGEPLVDPSTLSPPPPGSEVSAPAPAAPASETVPASEVPAAAPPVPPVVPETVEPEAGPVGSVGDPGVPGPESPTGAPGVSGAPVVLDPTEPQAPPPVEGGTAGAPAA